jgi:dihydrodipicolinate synthase/N-acetylneuraminate lyase
MESGARPTRRLIGGIVPPMVTPLADRDALDVPGLGRLVEHILAGGVHGLFVLGTTGEGPSLGYRVRCELVDRVCEQVAGRVPVLVGITDPSFVESVSLAEHAADAGAGALVLAPPFYFPMGQAELVGYVTRMAAEAPLPLVLYNLPALTKTAFEPDTVRRLVEVPNIVGLKDSSGDMRYFRQVRQVIGDRRDWSLLIGPEELLAEATLLGADGGVCGGANVFPRLYVELFEAASRGDARRAAALHARVMAVSQGLYHLVGHGAAVIAGLKGALACLGICSDLLAEPFPQLSHAQRRAIRACLARIEPELNPPARAHPAQPA